MSGPPPAPSVAPPPPPPPPPAPTIPPPDYQALVLDLPDNVQAAANGLKIIGEIIAVPGTSLFAEGRVGQGAIFAALGLFGGWAGGTLLGPLGYILFRYGASAISFYESFATTTTRPPAPTAPPPSDGTQTVAAVNNVAQYVYTVANQLAAHQQNAATYLDQRITDLTTRVAAITPTPQPTSHRA